MDAVAQDLSKYTWLFVITCIWACIDSYGIGANDVANSFSTSVGAKTLTLKQACMIATVTELAGALLLGANTASTLNKSVLEMSVFTKNPGILMLAMFCTLIGSATWTLIATKFGWPVSTTHAIVGATVGVGIAGFGLNSVKWGFDGVAKIVCSWFLSPLTAGVVASGIFLLTRWLILSRENSFERGLKAIPIYFGLTALVNASYVLLHHVPNPIDTVTYIKMGGVAGITIFVTLFCFFFVIPFLRRKLKDGEQLFWYHMFIIRFLPKRTLVADLETEEGKKVDDGSKSHGIFKGMNVDILEGRSADVQQIMDSATRYDADTEYMYSLLQVITASMSSFAHGSNDVANAVGPLSVAYNVWHYGYVPKEIEIPIWILIMGGLFIDIGLLTYGYKIFQSLGGKITYLSPSRGFSMELGTSLTVITCSHLGLPVSTTHCITGATAAVGLCNGSMSSINWKMLGWCFFSWFLTLPAAGCTSGLLFYLCSRSPSM